MQIQYQKWPKYLIFMLLICGTLFGQRISDPNTGDEKMRRQGIMDGNLVRSIFINWGEVAHWPDQPSGEWPKGTGHQYVDGVALVVQARAIDDNGNVIHPLETQYREFVDRGPQEELWGWAPVPGYFNPKQNLPALSDESQSWPDYWPDKADGWVNPNEIRNDFDDDGNGLVDDLVYWNGFFGKGVLNADLETFFVFDDDQDEEWNFTPDPANPDRRGMGIEVAARYFQWQQVLAEDVIFALYFITNEGQYNYDSTYYSFYIDWGIGGTDDSSDDTGDYDTFLDLAWAWDGDGFGSPNNWSPVGQAGFAFLESPGIDTDFLDNDEDGIIDEERDSGPGVFIDSPPYVDDPAKFLLYYGREPGPHWSGDEDADWISFTDIDENGRWDEGETLNDDVGEDGLGPNDFGYPGPDAGEGDGMPTAGEPNFDFTDKDEADQIGLTGFEIFPVHKYELWNEEQNWDVFRSIEPPHGGQVTANLGMFFSSGPFPLQAGQTENYSMALLFGEDKNDLVLTKKTIQQIYNADYRFAKPPNKPKLKAAIPGNQRVILVWDDRAEKSWDPFLQEYDFQGYRIYRSTEPEFLEPRLITDAYGRSTFSKPIAQFDLKDDWVGLHPIHVQGAHYDMGENTGLRHYFIDEDVVNGQTYYYAVVSYDHGLVDTSATGELAGLAPAECTSNIEVDISGNVKVDINTAVVVPRAPAAGYLGAEMDGTFERNCVGTGDVQLDFLLGDSVATGHSYQVEFGDTAYFHNVASSYYVIYDVTNGAKIAKTDTVWFESESQSPLVDGFVLNIENDEAELDMQNTGWVMGNTNYRWRVNQDTRFSKLNLNTNFASDYEITFADEIVDTAENLILPPDIPTKFSVYNQTIGEDAKYFFFEFSESDSTLSPYYPTQPVSEIEGMIVWEEDPDPANPFHFKASWRLYFEADTNLAEQIAPLPGDVFRIATKKPYRNGDKINFKVLGPRYDKEKAKNDLDDIAVVPNPYVVAASWEPRSPFKFGRGERKIDFIHLPKNCTIRIYTMRGYLVDVLEHNSTFDDGAESWNMISKDGQEIAYGVYIFHVDANELGEKIGKFAIIK